MTTTLSREARALIAYAKASGIPHKVTATLGTYQSASQPCYPHAQHSYHCRGGTAGRGLAVDFAGPHGGNDTLELAAIWAVFHGVAGQLYQLIYAGHECILAGKPFAYDAKTIAGHHNHVHVAVERGTFLSWHNPEVVVPQYDPPIRMAGIVADAFVAEQGYYRYWQLDEDGWIHPWLGAPVGHATSGPTPNAAAPAQDGRVPKGTRWARLEADAGSYTCIAVDGSRYGYAI